MWYTLLRTAGFVLLYALCVLLGWLTAYLTGMDILLSIMIVHWVFLIVAMVADPDMHLIDFFFLPSLFINIFMMFPLFAIEHFFGDIFYEKIHLASQDYRRTYREEKSHEVLVLSGLTKNKVYISIQGKKWKAHAKGASIFLENGDKLVYQTENRPHQKKEGFGIRSHILSGVIQGDTVRCVSEELFEYTDGNDIYVQ